MAYKKLWCVLIGLIGVSLPLQSMAIKKGKIIIEYTLFTVGVCSVGVGIHNGLMHGTMATLLPFLMNKEHRKYALKSFVKNVIIPLGIGALMIGASSSFDPEGDALR